MKNRERIAKKFLCRFSVEIFMDSTDFVRVSQSSLSTRVVSTLAIGESNSSEPKDIIQPDACRRRRFVTTPLLLASRREKVSAARRAR